MDRTANDHGGPATARVGANAPPERGRRGAAPSDDAASPRRDPSGDKAVLRTALRQARAALVDRPPLPVPEAFAARLAHGAIVAAYAAVGAEADPIPLVAAARRAGCIIAYPRVTDRASLLRFLVDDGRRFVAGPFGLVQPPADAAEVRPSIILTPLVGFDRAGHRLGQGAGHYDRAFAAPPDAWRIGIAWSGQEIDRVPTDPWDVPLHAVATEGAWIVAA